MKILYLGDAKPHTNSWWRARVLGRLGHEVTHIDLETKLTGGSRLMSYIHFQTGYGLIQSAVKAALRAMVADRKFDVVWVDGGAIYGPEAIRWLKGQAQCVLNYNVDDPIGMRDWSRWETFRKAIPFYDLCLVVREQNILEYYLHGAKRVGWVLRSYDEVEMVPRKFSEAERKRWSSEVLFVGTWMPERCVLLTSLVKAGVPLSLYGNRWEKSPNWETLRGCWRGKAVVGSEYVAAVQNAQVCLGLVSHGNRDLHTLRTFEIPILGSLFLAERTLEHRLLYEEDREAVFFSSAAECAEKCHTMLADEPRRKAIALAGYEKVMRMGVSHADVLAAILRDITGEEALPRNPIEAHLAMAAATQRAC